MHAVNHISKGRPRLSPAPSISGYSSKTLSVRLCTVSAEQAAASVGFDVFPMLCLGAAGAAGVLPLAFPAVFFLPAFLPLPAGTYSWLS